MTDLQILLITIGVVLIVIVVLYNGWQDWRARRSMRQSLPETDHDVLMQPAAERREPVLGPSPADGSAGGAAGSPPSPASLAAQPVASAASPVLAQPTALDEAPDVDATSEAVIDIAFAHPVSGEYLGAALAKGTRMCKKPVRYFAGRAQGGHAQGVRADEQYSSVHLAVVLANRSGPLTDIDWSHVWALAQTLAEQFDGMIEGPEQSQVLQQAAALDARCAALDAQVGLILQLPRPQPARQIRQVAAEAGFEARQGGLTWLSETGQPYFTLQIDGPDDQPLDRVDLLLDVPNSLPDDQAFSRMLSVGRDLAARLDAEVLDDQGRTFHDSSAATIDQQINALYHRLDEAGFLAGSERAARVFS